MPEIMNDGEQDYLECPKCAAGHIYSLECDCCGYTEPESEDPSPASQPEFPPTPEQSLALAAMTDFLTVREEKFFVLRGYAGTGKSYSITLLAKGKKDDGSPRFKPSEICFTAPTNKAVKVLRNYLDGAGLSASPSKTIYSLLGLSLQANGEVKQLTKPEEPVDLSSFKVIVVDEASMVNRFLMDAINDAYADWSVPFIFMGDPAQLPPVGEITAPVWKLDHGSELTQVMRYGNSMLDLATAIRKVVDSPFPSVKIETNAPVYRWPKAEWLNRIEENLDLFRSGDAKCIAWRNVTVDGHNAYIRKLIFGQEARLHPWLLGDKIVATTMLKDLQDNTFMKTDEEATVLEVATGHHPLHPEFEIFNLLVEDERGRKVTIRVPTPSGQFALNNRLNELSMEAKKGQKWKWREFWLLKERFHEVRHSYAITSHRSQGSSYLKVFIDLEDILLNRNRSEAFRALYVACTRQREELHVA
jgi:exodeoxyribonuclease-5